MIRAGFEDFKLRLWLRSPMLCRHCPKYGHTAKRCRTKQPRCLQCSEDHQTSDCKSKRKRCPHCCGPHAAWERSCPVIQDFFNQEKKRHGQADHLSESKQTSEEFSQTQPQQPEACVQTRTPSWAAGTQTKRIAAREAQSQATGTADRPTPQAQYPIWSPVQTRQQRQNQPEKEAALPRRPHPSQWGERPAAFSDSEETTGHATRRRQQTREKNW